jgi:hypothetical protein
VRLAWHVFHLAQAAGTLSIMSLRPAILRLVFPVVLLLIGSTSCQGSSVDRDGTIRIRILAAGGKGVAGLGIDHCKRSVDPNEILKIITMRDPDGMEVARMTVHGRDATAKKVGVDGRRCVVTAVKDVEVYKGGDYEITADGETIGVHWPVKTGEDCCTTYDIYAVDLLARGVTETAETAEIDALVGHGYLRVSEISRMWSLDTHRVRQIVKRDDFPAPAKVVATRNLLLLEDLEAWWLRGGRHAPR